MKENKLQIKKEYASKEYASKAYALGNFTNKDDLVLIKEAWLDGFNTATKWYSVDNILPESDKKVLIKVKDYRRPDENVTSVHIGYYDKIWYYDDSDSIVDSGHGWFIFEWMNIPE